MPAARDKIEFDHKGIGASLAHLTLAVPLNQREYSWEPEHVQALLQDVARAIQSGQASYFLGTLVLTRGDGSLEVADGQQRLATTAIFLSAVRDYLFSNGNRKRAGAIEQKYLLQTDLTTEETIPRLTLNVDDNDFFTKSIISTPDSPDRRTAPTKDSHRRMIAAAALAAKYVEQLVAPYKEADKVAKLVEWVDFIETGVEVITLTVPDHLNAFVMFETLNDRGLRASQADLLKNYLLRHAGNRIGEAQQKWATMLGCLESLGLEEDTSVTYLRHVVICLHGVTREREVYGKVRDTITSQPRAMDFLAELAGGVLVYAAIFNPEHSFWNPHGSGVRGHVRTLLDLRVEQIRPLVFAAMRKFDATQLRSAFRLFVSWSVRFLVAGGGRGGALDRAYSERALDVFSGRITSAKDLAKAMNGIVPTDAEFEAAFATARVSQNYLARYYLRALELTAKGQPDPETIPNEGQEINLEHVLPETPGQGWAGLDPEIAATYCRRLGNMALLRAQRNVAIGNKPFAEKRTELANSAYLLTNEIGKKPTWGVAEINERQARLAKLALSTWPLTVA